MKRNRLTATFVETVTKCGRYTEAGSWGLTLYVKRNKQGIGRYWVQRLMVQGDRIDRSLGSTELVSLKQARELAFLNKQAILLKRQPFQVDNSPLFHTVADRYIAEQLTGTTDQTVKLWHATMRDYIYPAFGDRRVSAITTADVKNMLVPIWLEKLETAKKVRQRTAAIFHYASAEGHSVAFNDNDLGAVLPKRESATTHRAALPHDQVPAAMKAIRQCNGSQSARLAVEMLILTGLRSLEIRGLKRTDVDFPSATLTVPAARMKMNRDHRVPLSSQCLELLALQRGNGSELIFPAAYSGGVLGSSRLREVLKLANVPGTIHGFRSALRDYCTETAVPFEVSEAILGHQEKSPTVRAYARSDLFDQRKPIMEAWAEYVLK